MKMDDSTGWSRRSVLGGLGAAAPTLRLMLAAKPSKPDPGKFTPVDLGRHFNTSSSDFGPRDQAKQLGRESAKDGLIRTPAGEQEFQGIPFSLGPEGVAQKQWVVLSQHGNPSSTRSIEVPLQKKAAFVCMAAFCDWDPNEWPFSDEDVAEQVGQRLADVVFIYEDGGHRSVPIRRRFEVNAVSYEWGHLSFAALTHLADAPRKLTDALASGLDWGDLQTAVWDNKYPSGDSAVVWVSALENPEPARSIKTLRFDAASQAPLVICGLTLFHGHANPLRRERLSLYRLTLPEAAAEDSKRWELSIDLGVIARSYALADFDAPAWMAAPAAGMGEPTQHVKGARHLYIEICASPDATLWLRDSRSGKQYAFELGKAGSGEEHEAKPQGARIQMLEREKTWLQGQVLDAVTGRPTPVRLAFRTRDGRYIPPYGHRTEVNASWFEDYGADLQLRDSSFAYIDGSFQVELPVGEVYVEITKGFEYAPVRKQIQVAPGQRELKLEISRSADFRGQGWMTADTHVHFLSPSTALLEAQAEGLNLVNLLAAQWGDLFTNVGDLSHEPLTTRDGEATVWVGTENRQHLLGHLGLLGGHGMPVYPMSASGTGESYLGDPLWTSLADWADRCRKREGIVVAVHFPRPTAELAADIVMGKIDAVELYPYGGHFRSLPFLDWYRYLNCGYRLPAAGGTDKMGAYMPVGANRTYAYIGQDPPNFANWAKAVRSGNTFMTTGPLILFHADGRVPGSDITLGAGGGTIEIQAAVKSFVPVHRVEVVLNGRTVAAREEPSGARELTLREKVHISEPGWIAARCSSRLGPETGWPFGIQAHTSPVYLGMEGREVFSAPGAAYMLTLIEGAEYWARNIATRPDPEEFERAVKVFSEARERLHQRLHAHGVEHSH